MTEDKLTEIRKEILKSLEEYDVLNKTLASETRNTSSTETFNLLISTIMKTEDVFQHICKLGLLAAKLRNISSENVVKAEQELSEVSKDLRRSIAKKDGIEITFNISQFQLLQRKVLREVGYVTRTDFMCEGPSKANVPVSKTIFIVHGKDDTSRLELARMLEKMNFKVIILSEQADRGRTLIEKLEDESLQAGYAFVLLTPDDTVVSGRLSEKLNSLAGEDINEGFKIEGMSLESVRVSREDAFSSVTKHARQNVILELGYFVGKIGRNRVCCLYKGNLELPSDIHGVVYKKFEKSIDECYKSIIEELKAAGYDIKV
jgi:predicted nucleotide-binding protein